MRTGQRDQRPCELREVATEDRRAFLELESEGGVGDVCAGRPKVDPPTRGSRGLGQGPSDGHDVVAERPLEGIHAFERDVGEVRCLVDGRGGVGRYHAELRFGERQSGFHSQRSVEPGSPREDLADGVSTVPELERAEEGLSLVRHVPRPAAGYIGVFRPRASDGRIADSTVELFIPGRDGRDEDRWPGSWSPWEGTPCIEPGGAVPGTRPEGRCAWRSGSSPRSPPWANRS